MKTLRSWGMNGLTKAVSFVNDKREWREELCKSPSPEPIKLSTLQFLKSPLESRTFLESWVSMEFFIFKFSFNFNWYSDSTYLRSFFTKCWLGLVEQTVG